MFILSLTAAILIGLDILFTYLFIRHIQITFCVKERLFISKEEFSHGKEISTNVFLTIDVRKRVHTIPVEITCEINDEIKSNIYIGW